MAYALADLIPELSGLEHYHSPTSIYLGGQSASHACKLVVSEWLSVATNCTADPHNKTAVAWECLEIQDGPSPFYLDNINNVTAFEVFEAANHGTICSSTNGSAPEVRVPYQQCTDKYYPGWERSALGSLSQWIGPLVQFILPSLAFCLSIPRGWKFNVPDNLFDGRPSTIWGVIFFAGSLVVALFLVFLDTVIWLACCFAFAGPMLLSSLIEYMLDRKVLEYLADQERILPSTQTRLLLSVVAGNLRIEGDNTTPASPGAGSGSNFDGDQLLKAEEGDATPVSTTNSSSNTGDTTWDRVMAIAPAKGELPTAEAKLWLKSLVNTQMSFGGAVGAPIIFFIGGFIYNVIDAGSSRGNEDTAEALAFGMWWMVIPHTAIIASAMLAANNPGALQGILGPRTPSPQLNGAGLYPGPWLRFLRSAFHQKVVPKVLEDVELIERAYDTDDLEPVSVWNRGLNKRMWINRVIESLADPPSTPGALTPEQQILRKATLRIGTQDKADIFSRMIVLLGAPFALAFSTAYSTPRTGLGCRSLTHLLYFLSQVAHIILWYWGRSALMPDAKMLAGKVMRIVCRSLQILVGLVAVFSAIGGTIMQVIGVYRNCFCKIPAKYWPGGQLTRPEAYAILSNITREDVVSSKSWTYTGLVASGVLAIVSALGWWHQRRLRKMFQQIVEALQVAGDSSVGNGTWTICGQATTTSGYAETDYNQGTTSQARGSHEGGKPPESVTSRDQMSLEL